MEYIYNNRNITTNMQSYRSVYQQNPIHYSVIFNIKHIYLVVYQIIVNNGKYLI